MGSLVQRQRQCRPRCLCMESVLPSPNSRCLPMAISTAPWELSSGGAAGKKAVSTSVSTFPPITSYYVRRDDLQGKGCTSRLGGQATGPASPQTPFFCVAASVLVQRPARSLSVIVSQIQLLLGQTLSVYSLMASWSFLNCWLLFF